MLYSRKSASGGTPCLTGTATARWGIWPGQEGDRAAVGGGYGVAASPLHVKAGLGLEQIRGLLGLRAQTCLSLADPQVSVFIFKTRLQLGDPLKLGLPTVSRYCPWFTSCSFLAQVILRSCSGINFEEFYHFLKVIAKKRLLVLAKEAGPGELEGGEGAGLGPQQATFDVGRIAEVLASVVVHPDFQRLDTSVFSPQPKELLQQLEEVVATTMSL